MVFTWDEENNIKLKEERSISFERIVVAIEEEHLIDVIENPNIKKYRNQLILIVDIDGYAVCVPCVQQINGDYFLKTVFPS
jgi:hypothetical protein